VILPGQRRESRNGSFAGLRVDPALGHALSCIGGVEWDLRMPRGIQCGSGFVGDPAPT
jgi:hypothetical protein